MLEKEGPDLATAEMPVILVGGQDRTAEILPFLDAAVASVPPSRHLRGLHENDSAMSLLQSAHENDYQDRLISLLRMRRGMDTRDFEVPVRPGWIGRLQKPIRVFLWRLLKYQHDRMAFQQNMINEMLVSALEYERSLRRSPMPATPDHPNSSRNAS